MEPSDDDDGQRSSPQKVYKAYLTNASDAVLLKHRFHKKYRHPALSSQITRARITSEARSLARCTRGGVRVPQVRVVDVESGIIGIEWIDGKTVRSLLGDGESVDEGDEKTATGWEVTHGKQFVLILILRHVCGL